MGPVARHPFLDHAGPLAIVHRGGAAEAHENTAAAFRRAIDLGFRYVETDVQATPTASLLAFHDRSLSRVTNLSGRVNDLTYEQVAQARIGGRSRSPCCVTCSTTSPTVASTSTRSIPRRCGRLVEVLTAADALDRVCLASFSDARLRWLRSALGPGACTGLGPARSACSSSRRSAVRWPLLGRLPATALCAQVPVGPGPLPLVDRRFVDTAHDQGLAVHVWTVDDTQTMHRLLDLGVDGIMTDRPAALRDVLVQRGQWPSPAD